MKPTKLKALDSTAGMAANPVSLMMRSTRRTGRHWKRQKAYLLKYAILLLTVVLH